MIQLIRSTPNPDTEGLSIVLCHTSSSNDTRFCGFDIDGNVKQWVESNIDSVRSTLLAQPVRSGVIPDDAQIFLHPDDLSQIRAYYKSQIDKCAEVKRASYLTPGETQQSIYAAKQAELEHYQNGDTSNLIIMQAEASVRNITLKQQADLWIQSAVKWQKLAAVIEANRVQEKANIDSATTLEIIEQSVSNFIKKMDSLQ